MVSMFSLTGRVALVTGGGRGIGKAIALGFAEADADVVVATRTAAEIEKTAEKIRAASRRALAIVCDVTDVTQVTSDDELREELERVPLGRAPNPEDVVGGAIYLASSASEYVTGKTIAIDGGLTRP
jgi:NAD(P)-dependent dehydrogenase (short-subunit alcohol dehydrogenase family)